MDVFDYESHVSMVMTHHEAVTIRNVLKEAETHESDRVRSIIEDIERGLHYEGKGETTGTV
tara:strand:+ start:39 stop:221 length:183 start_codon:yes stop_codon:yes gene_type:complete